MTTNGENEKMMAGESIKDFIDGLSFGEYLRNIRTSDDISQTELASKLSVTKQFISAIETGKESVGLDFAKRVADALGYSLAPFAKILLSEQIHKYDTNLEIEIKRKAS